MVSSTLLIAACGNSEKKAELEITTGTDQSLLPPENELTMNCPEAIQTYLDNAKKAELGTTAIQENDAIVVEYIGRLADGTVFDTSIESVAKACGTYNSQRDYTEGLPFTVGAGQMIKGFDTGVLGMKLNETKTIDIPVEQAYGARDETRVMTYPLSEVPNAAELSEGMQLPTIYGTMATITKITDKEITLDTNHQLAGKDLIFDITIRAIN